MQRIPAWIPIGAIAMVCALCLSQHAYALAVEDRPWLRLQGDVFTLYSDLSPAKARTLFRELQLYYLMFHILTDTSPGKQRAPANFYAFSRETDLRAYGLDRDHDSRSRSTRGAFHATYRGSRKNLSYFLKSDYARHLFRSRAGDDYPLWYEVGMNEYLASITQRAGLFRIGDSVRVRYLKWNYWIRLEEVLEPDDADLQNGIPRVFRAESWLLYHYLNHVDETARERFPARLARYLELRDAGASEIAAFEAGFGIPLQGLAGRLQHFYTNPKHRVLEIGMQDWVREDAIPTAEPLGRAEAALVLGRLARALERDDEATRLLIVAAERPPSLHDAEIGCALARLETRSAAKQAANIEQLLRAQPSHTACLIELAEALLNAGQNETNPTRVVEHAERIRHVSETLVQQDRNLAVAFATYGRSFLLPGQDAARAIAPLIHARDLAIGDLDVRLYLADGFRAANDCAGARHELRYILTWAPDIDRVRAAATRRLTDLDIACVGVESGADHENLTHRSNPPDHHLATRGDQP